MNDNIKNNNKNIIIISVAIMVVLILVAGATFAYFAFTASNNTTITGDVGKVDLSLSVVKVLPNSTGVDDLLLANFNDLAGNLNNKCLYSDGVYALCQVYKITLTNKTGAVNTKVKGSLSFDNTESPNLSWIRLDNYSSSKTYVSSDMGSTYNTASSEYKNFVDSYLLKSGNSVDYYIVLWVNESEESQTDMGSFTGTVRFEDENGKGVTSTFGS